MNLSTGFKKSITDIDVLAPPRQYIADILCSVCDNMGYGFGSVIDFSRHGQWSMVSSYNLPEDYPKQVARVGPLLSGPFGEALATSQVVVVNDTLSDPRLEPWFEIIRTYNLQTIVWVPLIRKDKAFGACILYDSKVREVSEGEIQTLEQISISISIAIANNQYLYQLNTRTKELEREIAERAHLERERDQIIHDMGERVKELACMYGLSESIRTRERLEEVFQDILDLIPPGWHYPEITRGKIVFDQKEYVSEVFEETVWKQSSNIIVNGEPRGSIQVYYLEECPNLDEGPFMKEERDLIDGMARSISEGIERKKAARALEKARVELERRAAELEHSNQELEDFAYIASHDLKEPLRGIRTYSGFLFEDHGDKLDSDGKHKLQTLERLAARMESLLDDLLHFSRVGRVELALKETDLGLLVEEIVDSLHITIEEQGGQVTPADDLPSVVCDRTRIGEVFRNLIVNGMKYNTEDNKRVEIGCRTLSDGDDRQVFFVRDNGIGIPEKHIEKIFKIFKRLHGRDKFGGGSGSGLTISQKIIERHGGRIWLKSEYGKGSTFFFTLGG